MKQAMFRNINILALTMLVCGAAACQTNAKPATRQQPTCDDAGTQSELDACASQAAHQADANLAQTRKSLLTAWSARPKDQKLLKLAEAKWEGFRKAQLTALYPLAHIAGNIYGTVMPMCYDDDWQDFSNRHREVLAQLISPQSMPCGDVDPAAADRDLNDVYQRLLAKLSGDSHARIALIESERVWIPYRDAMLSLQASVLRDPTDSCRHSSAAAITRERILELKAMLHPEEDDTCGYSHPMSKEDLAILGD